MSTTEFAASVGREGDAAVLDLSGEITSAAESRLNMAYGEVEDANVVICDFADVDYINSTGIALIVGILAKARGTGQEIQARGLAEHYREIFRITRLSDFMTILDDEGD